MATSDNEDPPTGPRWPRRRWAPFYIPLPRLPEFLPQRLILATLAHSGFMLLYVMRSNMSMAIVRLTSSYEKLVGDEMQSVVDFPWTAEEQGFLLSSFFIGYILTQIPGGYLALKMGGRRVFGFGLLSASLVTTFTPVIGLQFGYPGFVATRIMCGLFEGVTYPAIHSMWNHWAPQRERTTLVSFSFGGAYLGAALSMSTHYLRASCSWEDLFYMTGAYALLWSVLWFMWGSEYPEDDPMLTEKERNYLLENTGTASWNSDLPIPWKHILNSPKVISLCFCHFAANWGFYTVLTELPTFLSKALKLDAETLSTYSSLPFFLMAITATIGGLFIDRTLALFLNTTMTRKATIAVSFVSQMMFFFLASKATAANEFISYMCGALFFCGLSWAGFGVNHLDIAPDYACILLGITNTFGTLPGIISPIVTGFMVKDQEDVSSWGAVFLVAGYMYMGACAHYMLYGSGELQDWANTEEAIKLNARKRQVNDPESASD